MLSECAWSDVVLLQGRFAKGRKLGTGASNVVHVVILDGTEYAGRSIIALTAPAFREMYGLNSTAAIQHQQQPGGMLAALEEEIQVAAILLRHSSENALAGASQSACPPSRRCSEGGDRQHCARCHISPLLPHGARPRGHARIPPLA